MRGRRAAVELRGIERFTDHAGGGEENLFALLSVAFAQWMRERGGLLAGLAGEGVGVAGIDHEGARLAALQLSRHQSTAALGHFDFVNTPATVVPLSNNASSTSVRFL